MSKDENQDLDYIMELTDGGATILRFNRNHVGNKYSRIAIAMGKNKSIDLANEVEKLNEKIGMPSCLSEMQVTENMIPQRNG